MEAADLLRGARGIEFGRDPGVGLDADLQRRWEKNIVPCMLPFYKPGSKSRRRPLKDANM
jgi:hypothetical protein